MCSERLLPGETPMEFAIRKGIPLCMLLRANGVISPAWLFQERELTLPDENTCARNGFACPVMLLKAKSFEAQGMLLAGKTEPEALSQKTGLPLRLVLLAIREKTNAGGMILPVRKAGMRVHTCGLKDTWKQFPDEADLRLLNNAWGPLYPGMKILVYGD